MPLYEVTHIEKSLKLLESPKDKYTTTQSENDNRESLKNICILKIFVIPLHNYINN